MNITIKMLIPVILVTLLFFTGCTQANTNPTPSATTTPGRIDRGLTLSQPPVLGKTVDFTFIVDVVELYEKSYPKEGLARSKAWIDFYWTNIHGSFSEAYSPVQIPSEEVVIGGDLPWEGSYTDKLTLHGKIKLNREGIWSIRARFTGEGWSHATGAEIEVAVADGTAAIMGTEDFNNGPLAYLRANSYAGGVVGPTKPGGTYSVSLGLDISKPPRPGEEVTLSCRITSVIDIRDVSIVWSFYKGKDKIPETEILSSEDLNWKTDIKKDVPVVFSTTIKLPSEGNWDIAAVGKEGTKYLTGSGHRLKITITSTRSYFGWIQVITRPTMHDETGTTTTTTIPNH
jgi:hypothetical protein